MFERGVHLAATALGVLAGLALMALLIFTSADVTLRGLRGSGLDGAVEYGEILLVFVTITSLAYAYRHGAHVTTDFVTDRLPVRASAWVQAGGLTLTALIILVGVWISAEVAVESIREQEYRIGVTRVPMWPARMALPLGLAALFLEMMIGIRRQVRQALGKNPPEAAPDQSQELGAGVTVGGMSAL